MFVEECFRREQSDTSKTPDIFIPERPRSHRPPTRYRSVRITSRRDVEVARKAHLPVWLLEPEKIEGLGYSLSFRPRLLLPKPLLPLVETTYRVQLIADPEVARNPVIEDFIVAMLQVDALGARKIAHDHKLELDPVKLLKKILAENLEGRAYEVRLDDFAPGLPKIEGIRPLSRSALRVEENRVFATGPKP